MVEYSVDKNLDLIFHALADSTRRSLLLKIKAGPQKVTELASNYSVSLNAISKHLKVLEKASLIRRTVKGRVHSCEANPLGLESAEQWIDFYTKFWNQKLDNLENYLLDKKEEK